MKNILFAFFATLCFGLYACQEKSAFPEQVKVTKTADLKRIKGTRLFVAMPANYKPIENLVRLQRDENTYLQVLEMPEGNFIQYQQEMTKEHIESKGAQVDIVQPLQYNGYDALYFSGPSKTAGETKLGLAFGDETFMVMIAGVYRTNDEKALEELNRLMSTSYYDHSFVLDPFELVKFTFDKEISGFKLASQIGNSFIYTPNGKADLNNEEKETSLFQLTTLEMPDLAGAKEYLEQLLSRYESRELELMTIDRSELKVNGNPAYKVVVGVKEEQKLKAIVSHVIICKGRTAVLFMGFDCDNGKWLSQFGRTAESIKLQ